MSELFIQNKANSCATISAYQWIQLCNMTYEQYKKMIKDVGTKDDLDCLNFVEPVIKKYWNQKDPMKYPQFEHALPFKGVNKSKRAKCATCIPWKNGEGYEGVTDEYLAFDWWCRMMLRVESKIDINDYEDAKLAELWNYGIYGEKNVETKPRKDIVSMKQKYMAQVDKFSNYMIKATKGACVPFVCYEIVFFSDNKTSEYHAYVTVCYKNAKNQELNSNIAPQLVDNCTLIGVRKTSGRWTVAPPKKSIFDFYDDK